MPPADSRDGQRKEDRVSVLIDRRGCSAEGAVWKASMRAAISATTVAFANVIDGGSIASNDLPEWQPLRGTRL